MNDGFYRLIADHLIQEEVKAERWKLMRDIVVGLVCLVALLVAVGYPTKAHAVQLDQMGCMALAVWSHDVVLMRDMGADKEKVRAYFKEQDTKEQPVFGLLLREFDKLWATTSPREAVAQPVYTDCVKRRGVYGTDV